MSSLLSAGRPTIAAVALEFRRVRRCLALASLGISLLSITGTCRSRLENLSEQPWSRY